MSEVNQWKALKPWLPQGHYSRIESPDTSPGVSDVNYRIPAAEGWIELKDNRATNPEVPFPNEKKGLRKSQLIWIPERVAFGGIVWIAARVGIVTFWVPGKYAGAFNGATLKRLGALAHYIDPGRPDVRKLKRMLEGEGQ